MAETTVHMMKMEDKPYGESQRLKQYLAAIAAALGAVTAGTILAWTSPSLGQLIQKANATANGTIIQANVTVPGVLINATTDLINSTLSPILNAGTQSSFFITDEEGSWVGSLLAIGAMISAMPTGMLVEKIGRKPTILSLAVPFLLSWILIMFAQGPNLLYAGRFFAGIATGGICVTAPLYIGEVAETAIRGALGAFFQLFLTVGILLTFIVGGLTDWRTLSIISAAVPVLFAVCFVFFPETPQYLLAVNKRREAERSLRFLRGPNYDIAPELETMQRDVDEAARNKAGFTDLLSTRASVMALVCSLGLMFFQQFSGINAVIFYTEQIFDAAGTSINPSVASCIVGVVQVVATLVSSLIIEKAGRRILLLQSAAVMGTCLIVLGVFFKLKEDAYDVSSAGWVPLISLVLFIVSFSLGFGPIPWMMMAELFSAEFKGVASGIAVTFNWLLVFLVTKTFPGMVKSIGGHNTFWTFSGFMIVCFFFVWFLIPETKGKTNAQIQVILSGKK